MKTAREMKAATEKQYAIITKRPESLAFFKQVSHDAEVSITEAMKSGMFHCNVCVKHENEAIRAGMVDCLLKHLQALGYSANKDYANCRSTWDWIDISWD